MLILAHSEAGHGWAGPFQPWEIHPALNHLPIAFLLGGVALDLYAWWRGRSPLMQVASGLIVAGVLTGILSALSGVLAYFTVPAHTEEAHRLMYWHLGIQTVSLVMFGCVAWMRWRNRSIPPTTAARIVGCLAAIMLLAGSAIGGYIVYHGGAGIDPELLAPAVRQSHSPESGASESQNHSHE